MLKAVWIIMIVLIALLQVRLWFGEGSIPQYREVASLVEAQESANKALERKNVMLRATTESLSKGGDAVDELARNNIGLIGSNETLFILVPADGETVVNIQHERAELPPLDGDWSFPEVQETNHVDTADDSAPKLNND